MTPGSENPAGWGYTSVPVTLVSCEGHWASPSRNRGSLSVSQNTSRGFVGSLLVGCVLVFRVLVAFLWF